MALLVTPGEVYENAMLRPEPTPQELEEIYIQGQLMAYDDFMRVAMERVRSRTRSDLDDVHSQVLPAGVEVKSMDNPVQSTSLPPSPQEEELSALEQTVGFTHGVDPDELFHHDSIHCQGLMFQLYVRDFLTEATIG